MPPPTRLELLLQLVPPDRVPALTLALNRYGITNEDAVELLLVLLFVDLDHILAKIPGTLAQTVSDIPAHVEAAIDAKIGDVAQTLAGAVNAATLTARGQIDDLKSTLKASIAAALADGVAPTIANLQQASAHHLRATNEALTANQSSWQSQRQEILNDLRNLSAQINQIHRVTAADKAEIVAALAEWHAQFTKDLAAEGQDIIGAYEQVMTKIGGDVIVRHREARDGMLADIEEARKSASASILETRKKAVAVMEEYERKITRTNRFGLAVLAGFAVVFLAGGFLAASWWQAASYQDTLSQTIQLYESKLPPGQQQVIPASVIADAAKLRDFLATHAPKGGR